MTQKEKLELTKKLSWFLQQHQDRVNQAIKDRKLYALCMNGSKHYLTSYEEYVQIMNDESFLFVYGL